jgi:hypothetical protein
VAKWSKERALTWMTDFSQEHDVVPSSSIRRYYKGPPDSELKRHWGGVRQALVACGAPLAEARLEGSGIRLDYSHSRGRLTDARGKREREMGAHAIRVVCTNCGWEETHSNAFQGVVSQRLHLEEAHGINPGDHSRKQRWRNPTDYFKTNKKEAG